MRCPARASTAPCATGSARAARSNDRPGIAITPRKMTRMEKGQNQVRKTVGSATEGAEMDVVDEKRRRLLGQLGKSAYAAPAALALMTMTAYAS